MVTGSTQGEGGRRADHRPGGGSVAFGGFSITDASSGASKEQAIRQRRYAITMAFRTACFIAMIFVPGVLRWVLFACAVFLPYVAVLFANQAHQRDKGTHSGSQVPTDATPVSTGDERLRLTSGEVISGEVINGDVEDDTDRRDDRVA